MVALPVVADLQTLDKIMIAEIVWVIYQEKYPLTGHQMIYRLATVPTLST